MNTEAVVAKAVGVIRDESLRQRNGLVANHLRVGLAWRVIELAAKELDPHITRRDQAITVLGIERKKLYG